MGLGAHEYLCGGNGGPIPTASLTPSTTRQGEHNQLLASAEATAARVVATVRKKNGDYSTGTDQFQNFRASELLGLSVEKAILVRTLDKIVRMSNLLDHEANVSDEPFEDSTDDVIGYMMCLRAYRESLNGTKRG